LVTAVAIIVADGVLRSLVYGSLGTDAVAVRVVLSFLVCLPLAYAILGWLVKYKVEDA
jgi:hypothetical protein